MPDNKSDLPPLSIFQEADAASADESIRYPELLKRNDPVDPSQVEFHSPALWVLGLNSIDLPLRIAAEVGRIDLSAKDSDGFWTEYQKARQSGPTPMHMEQMFDRLRSRVHAALCRNIFLDRTTDEYIEYLASIPATQQAATQALQLRELRRSLTATRRIGWTSVVVAVAAVAVSVIVSVCR